MTTIKQSGRGVARAKAIAKERQQQRDNARSKRIKAQQAGKTKAVMAGLPEAIDSASNVITLAKSISTSIPTVASASPKGVDIDTTIKGAMPLAPAPEGTRLKSRRHMVNEETLADITKLYNSNSIGAELAIVKRDALTLQWRLASFCCAVAARLQRDKEGALPLLAEFFNAIEGLGKGMSMIRTNAFRQWFEKYAPVTWGKPQSGGEKTFLFDAKKHRTQASEFAKLTDYFKTRAAHPYWLIAPEKGYESFDFDKNFHALLKKAMEIAALNEDERKEKFGDPSDKRLNLGKYPQIMELFNSLRREDAKINNGAAEENTENFKVESGEIAA